MRYSPDKRLLVYAEGEFGYGKSKTAEGVIRFGPYPITAIIDSTGAGKTADQLLGDLPPIPIVADLAQGLEVLCGLGVADAHAHDHITVGEPLDHIAAEESRAAEHRYLT